MAEEDLDLGDDDLDLGGDDFAGELDEMMGDDELGDDSSGGGEESDSELDSFFEDLSSIEDMDEGDSGPAEEAAEEVEANAEPRQEPAKAKKAAPKSEKKGGKLKIILPLLILLLGGTGGGLWFLGFFDEPELIQEEEITMAEIPRLQTMPAEKPLLPQKPITPIIEVEESPPPPPKPVVPKRRYLIQVATCTYQVCKNDFIESLRREGEPVFQRSSGEKYDFIELISKDVYSYRDASELAHEINIKNKMAGKASVKSQSNGYRITMGSFPALDRAKEVKFNIEAIFPGKTVAFNMEHIRKDYSTTKIYAGPYDSKSETRKVLTDLRSKDKFKGAFIVLY